MKTFNSSQVRAVIDPADLERVGKFRYHIYVEEQNKLAMHADHDARTLIEPADRRACTSVYWLEDDNGILGTVRAEVLSQSDVEQEYLGLEAFDFLEPDQIVYFSRLMIAPNARGSRIASILCFTGFQLGVVKNCSVGILLCKPELVPLFASYGYVAYADEFVHPEFGSEVPMAIVGEVDYLRPRAPSLASWLERYRPDSPYTKRFLGRIAQRQGIFPTERPRDRYLIEEA